MAAHRRMLTSRCAQAAGQAADLARAPDRRGDPVPGPDRVRLAVPACGSPALPDQVTPLTCVACGTGVPLSNPAGKPRGGGERLDVGGAKAVSRRLGRAEIVNLFARARRLAATSVAVL